MATAFSVAADGRQQQVGVERAADRGLLDDEPRISRMEIVDDLGDLARLVDRIAQVAARPLLAGAERQDRAFEAGLDEVVLERGADP